MTTRRRRDPAPPTLVRDEAVYIATGDTRYTIDLDERTVEALERGICPEDLAQRMHDLLRWRRDAIRATTRDPRDDVASAPTRKDPHMATRNVAVHDQVGAPVADPRHYRVKIVGKDHPHRGEYGRFTGEVIRLVTGSRMALVKLEHCTHGTDGCYVSPGDVRQVDEEDQYV